MDTTEPILDEYHCTKCDGMMRRRICYENIICEDPILYCSFCGTKYEDKKSNIDKPIV